MIRVAEPPPATSCARSRWTPSRVDTALSPDGSRLAVAGADSDAVPVFDVRTGDVVFELREHASPSTPSRGARTADGSPRAPCDSSVRVWDAATGALEERLLGHTGVVITVDWSPDSRRIVSGGSDGTARVWELEVHPTQGPSRSRAARCYLLAAQRDPVGRCSRRSRPTAQRVLTGDVGIAAVKIWDLSIEGDAEVVNVPTDAGAGRRRVPPGRADRRIVRRRVRRDLGRRRRRDGAGDDARPRGRARTCPCSWSRRARTASWSRWSATLSPIVSVWNVETGTLRLRRTTFGHDVASRRSIGAPTVAISPSASSTDALHVLDADDGGRRTLVGHEPDPHVVQALAFAPDGRTDRRGDVQPRGSGHEPRVDLGLEGREGRQELDAVSASSLTYDGSGDRLAIGFFDGTVEIRDASTGEVERSFGAGSVTVMDVVFSPDGQLLATGGEDAAVRLFDTRRGERRATARAPRPRLPRLGPGLQPGRKAAGLRCARRRGPRVGARPRRADRDRGGRAHPGA